MLPELFPEMRALRLHPILSISAALTAIRRRIESKPPDIDKIECLHPQRTAGAPAQCPALAFGGVATGAEPGCGEVGASGRTSVSGDSAMAYVTHAVAAVLRARS